MANCPFQPPSGYDEEYGYYGSYSERDEQEEKNRYEEELYQDAFEGDSDAQWNIW